MHDVRRAYQPVFDVLTQPGLHAPGAQRIAERIGLNINLLEDSIGIPRKPPETPIEVRLQRALVREYTGIIAEMDTFMAALNDKVPEGPQIRNEALALRDAVRKLRRFTAQGAPDRRIVQELAAAIAAQRVLLARVERVNLGRPPGPNVLRLRRIGEALGRIQSRRHQIFQVLNCRFREHIPHGFRFDGRSCSGFCTCFSLIILQEDSRRMESGLSSKDADHRVSQRRKGGTSDNCMAAPVAVFAPGWTLASR